MAREFKRTDRLGDAFQRALAQLIQFEVRDPRIGMVNVNDVQVNRDLSVAKVFVAFVGRDDEESCKEATAALNNAGGYLRTQLSKQLNIRTTPRLHFVYDRTALTGNHMSQLIDKAIADDESKSSTDSSADDESQG